MTSAANLHGESRRSIIELLRTPLCMGPKYYNFQLLYDLINLFRVVMYFVQQ